MNKVSERSKARRLGSVSKEPAGRWFKARLPASVDPSKPMLPGRYKTAGEAQKAIYHAIRNYNPKLAYSGIQGETLLSLCEQYVEKRYNSKINPIGINTRLYYEKNIRELTNKISKIYIKDLTTKSLSSLFQNLTMKQKKFLTIILRWGNDNEYINPPIYIPNIKVNKTKSLVSQNNKTKTIPPTYTQLADLITTEKLEFRFKIMVLVAAFGGLRLSELLALETNDIVDGGIIVDKVYVWDPQTKQHTREAVKAGISSVVPLPPPLLESLKIVARDAQGGILFHNRTGRYNSVGVRMRVDQFENMLAYVRRHGGPSFPFKSLRSFCGSIIVDSGASVVETAAYLRHTPKVSIEHYLKETSDPVRLSIRKDLSGESIPQRVAFLYDRFLVEFPEVALAVST